MTRLRTLSVTDEQFGIIRLVLHDAIRQQVKDRRDRPHDPAWWIYREHEEETIRELDQMFQDADMPKVPDDE